MMLSTISKLQETCGYYLAYNYDNIIVLKYYSKVYYFPFRFSEDEMAPYEAHIKF